MGVVSAGGWVLLYATGGLCTVWGGAVVDGGRLVGGRNSSGGAPGRLRVLDLGVCRASGRVRGVWGCLPVGAVVRVRRGASSAFLRGVTVGARQGRGRVEVLTIPSGASGRARAVAPHP